MIGPTGFLHDFSTSKKNPNTSWHPEKWFKMDLFGMTLKNKGISKSTSAMRSKCVETKIEFQKFILDFTYRAYEILAYRTYKALK